MCVGVLMCIWEAIQHFLESVHPTPALTTQLDIKKGNLQIASDLIMILHARKGKQIFM